MSEWIKGKTCVITGSTSGIGRICARNLAGMGAKVILISRNPQRCEDTISWIKENHPEAQLEAFPADLSSMAEIVSLSERLHGALEHIDVLVNNAGAMFTSRVLSADGLEMTFALNHLAYFNLSVRLLDLLAKPSEGRIVNVASYAHRTGKIDFDQIKTMPNYGGWQAYCNSKLANILFTRELAKRLSGSSMTVNCLHPGFVATRFGDGERFVNKLIGMGKSLFAISEEKGADTMTYLASSPEVKGISGRYFSKRKERKPERKALDDATAARLWQLSVDLTGVGDRLAIEAAS